MDKMIIKLQISQFSSDSTKRMLAYDETRDYSFESNATKEVLALMKGRPKAFFYATLDKELKFVIGEEAPWQNW